MRDLLDLLASRGVGFTYWVWWVDTKPVGATFGLIEATPTPVKMPFGTRTVWEDVKLSPHREGLGGVLKPRQAPAEAEWLK